MQFRSARVLLAALLATSCKTSFLGFGSGPSDARRNAGDGLLAHALRFDDVVRDTKATNGRTLISRHALTPSRIYNDSTVWNTVSERDSTRTLTVAGDYDQQRGGYNFRANPNVGAPSTLGESRHVLQLDLQADGAYTWDTSVEHAIGALPAGQAGPALTAFFASAESPTPTARDLRSESLQAFPRTARALGRLFALDSARSRSLPDGSSLTTMAVRWRSSGIRPTMPNFAGFVAKYIEPSKYLVQLSDRRGQTFLHVSGDRGALLVRWRSREGKLLPLEGGTTPMPDTLRLRLDFNTKYKLFRVGFAELFADFTVQRGAHAAAWMLRFRQEPKWQLPLFTETLIRSPLRRPFQGRGSEMYLAVRDDGGPQTLLVRRTHTAVKESAIIRWMGSLGASAMSDFQGRTEAEQNRFVYDAFSALRADLQDVLSDASKESNP